MRTSEWYREAGRHRVQLAVLSIHYAPLFSVSITVISRSLPKLIALPRLQPVAYSSVSAGGGGAARGCPPGPAGEGQLRRVAIQPSTCPGGCVLVFCCHACGCERPFVMKDDDVRVYVHVPSCVCFCARACACLCACVSQYTCISACVCMDVGWGG